MELHDAVLKRLETPGMLKDFLETDSEDKDNISSLLRQIQETAESVTPKNSCEVLQDLQRLRNELAAEINRRT